jgi:hypothetical protein
MGEENQGTGAIPKAAIHEVVNSRGAPGLVDTISVKHVSGGISSIALKAYEKGREKWQGGNPRSRLVRRGAAAGHLHRGPDADQRDGRHGRS